MSNNIFAPIGGTFVEMTGWTNISQAAPTTVQPGKPDIVKFACDVDNSYDPSVGGLKGIYQLAKTQSTAWRGNVLLGLLALQAGEGMQASYSISTSATISAAIRIRAILTKFDYTTTTWNTAAALTYGTDADTQTLMTVTGLTTTGGLFGFGDATQCYLCFQLNSMSTSTNVYGFVVDVRPKATQTNISQEFLKCRLIGSTVRRTRPRYFPASA